MSRRADAAGGRRELLFLAALLAAGFALRLFRLGDVPFGFHPDEGHNALDALRIAQGWRPVFLPGNNGREPAFMYGMALWMSVLGPTIATARLMAAVSGTLMIAAQWGFVRALPLPRARLAAWVGAGLMAFGFWPLAQSRYALRAVLLPVWLAGLLWAWWRAIAPEVAPEAQPPPGRSAARGQGPVRSAARRGASSGPPRLAWAALAGALLAGGLYTHLTARLMPAVLAASALWAAGRDRSARPLVRLAAALIVAAALALPQIAYFATHPEMLGYRAGQVSLLNPAVHEGDPAGALLENARRMAGMPLVRGDTSWYHNLRGRPAFDPLAALALLVGAAALLGDLAGRRGRRAQDLSVLLLAALGVTLAPSLLSEGAPNYVRLTGTWPVLFLLPGYGVAVVAEGVAARRGAPAGGRGRWARLGPALALLVVGWTAVATPRAYFGAYAGHPKTYEAFNGAAVERARAVAALVAEGPTYVTPAIWRQSVIRFVNVDDPPRRLDPREGLVFAPAGGTRLAFDPVEADDVAALEARLAPFFEHETVRDGRGAPSLEVFRSPDDLIGRAMAALAGAATVDFGDRIRWWLAAPGTLSSLAASGGAAALPVTAAPGTALDLVLLFEAAGPTDVDHNLFVHLVGPDGATVVQHDGPPLGGSHPTDRWARGEVVLQPVRLEIPADAPAGPAALRFGWYDWRTGERLPVAGDDDAAVEIADAVRLEPAGGAP